MQHFHTVRHQQQLQQQGRQRLQLAIAADACSQPQALHGHMQPTMRNLNVMYEVCKLVVLAQQSSIPVVLYSTRRQIA